MSRIQRRGFTLIEVSLFLAVTGALFVGILVGTQNSIWQQRYNDTVQNFAGFLRNVYSEVSNPQSLGDGRSDQAIYGKLISFGQKYGLDGNELSGDEQKIFVYDVIGDATGTGTGSTIDMLEALHANVVIEENNNGENDEDGTTIIPAGIVESYSPMWNSVIEAARKDNNIGDEGGTVGNLYEGSILIVRHPRSGTINTLVSDRVINVNKVVADANYDGNDSLVNILLTGVETNDGAGASVLSTFELKDVNFCVNPYGMGESGTMMRNIRIVKNARNASGVEIIGSGNSDDVCLD